MPTAPMETGPNSQITFHESDINSDFEDKLLSDVAGEFEMKVDTSDDKLLKITQEIENENKESIDTVVPEKDSARFGKELTEKELTDLQQSAKNKNTEKKMDWATRLFATWYSERNRSNNGLSILLASNDDDMNACLIRFITEVRNKSGDEYHGNTLHEILMSIQRYLRENDRNVNFQTDFEFRLLRQTLDAKMKSLARAGVGIHARKADVITDDQEDVLWKQNILGEDTPQKLLDTVFYLNGICFCLRGGEEHHSLKTGNEGNFSIITRSGVKHLKYSEGVTKTNQGGLNQKSLNMKTIVIGPNVDNPARCPVRLHEKYMTLRPTSPSPFYLRPLRYPRRDLWYAAQPIGRQTLGGTVKRLCHAAGFQGFFTNHSLRATTATRLYMSGVDEQLIAERTGHRSTSIRNYKRTSDKQLEEVDALVQRKKMRPGTLDGSCTTTLTTSSAVSVPSTSSCDVISFSVEKNGAKIKFSM